MITLEKNGNLLEIRNEIISIVDIQNIDEKNFEILFSSSAKIKVERTIVDDKNYFKKWISLRDLESIETTILSSRETKEVMSETISESFEKVIIDNSQLIRRIEKTAFNDYIEVIDDMDISKSLSYLFKLKVKGNNLTERILNYISVIKLLNIKTILIFENLDVVICRNDFQRIFSKIIELGLVTIFLTNNPINYLFNEDVLTLVNYFKNSRLNEIIDGQLFLNNNNLDLKNITIDKYNMVK